MCLATAAYAVPIPTIVQKALAGLRAAPLSQRLGGRRNVAAQELKEEVTGGSQVSAQLLERKAANRAKHLPVLTDRRFETLQIIPSDKKVRT